MNKKNKRVASRLRASFGPLRDPSTYSLNYLQNVTEDPQRGLQYLIVCVRVALRVQVPLDRALRSLLKLLSH